MVNHKNKIKLTHHLLVFPVILFLMTICCTSVSATEGGGTSYPLGADGFLGGVLPPPGFYYVNYLAHYTTNRFNDKNGHKIPMLFHANATANASRFVYQSPINFLGGQLGAYAYFILAHVSADTALGSKSKSGFGDTSIGVYNSWHFKNFHAAAAVECIMPTGSYDKNDIINIGRNYFSILPVLVYTYLADNGFEISQKIMYDFNTKNNATHYTSGQEFHFDYAVGWRIKRFTIGAAGYFDKQTTADDGPGVSDGNYGQVFAAGPALKWDFKSGGYAELKYMKEMLVENRPEGDKFFFKLVLPF